MVDWNRKWDLVVVDIDIWRAWIIFLGKSESELRSSLPGLLVFFLFLQWPSFDDFSCVVWSAWAELVSSFCYFIRRGLISIAIDCT